MPEIRCAYCGKLFEKADVRGVIEVKCGRCKNVNYFVLPTAVYLDFEKREPPPNPIVWWQSEQ